MNIVQKVVDVGLLLLAAGLIIGVISGLFGPAHAEPVALSSFEYTPGSFGFVCDVGTGPKWDELKLLTANLR
jgi:hypothetical protein